MNAAAASAAETEASRKATISVGLVGGVAVLLLAVLLYVVASRSRNEGASTATMVVADSGADNANDYYDDVEFAAGGSQGAQQQARATSTDARFGPPITAASIDTTDWNDVDFDELDFSLFRAGAAAGRARALAEANPRPAKDTAAMAAAGGVPAPGGGGSASSEYESIMAALALVKEARRAKESGAPATRRLKSKIAAVRNTIMSSNWEMDVDAMSDEENPFPDDPHAVHKSSFNVLDPRANRMSQYSAVSRASSAMTDGEDLEC